MNKSALKYKSLFCFGWICAFIILLPFFLQSALAQKEFVPLATQLSQASSVYVTSLNEVYITETGKHRLLKLDITGQRLDSLGDQGLGNYYFDSPLVVDATNGLKIYVVDYNNRRIQMFDRRFQYLSTIEQPPRSMNQSSYQPMLLAVNNLGELFFYDSKVQGIIKYNELGNFDMNLGNPGGRIYSPPAALTTLDNNLLVADSVQSVIHVLTNMGQYRKFWSTPEKPISIAAAGKNLWILGRSNIFELGAKGEIIQTIALEEGIKAVDLDVFNRMLYVLTPDKLYRYSLRGD